MPAVALTAAMVWDCAQTAMPLRLAPISLREANAAVTKWHRHHKPARGQKFSISCLDGWRLCGAAIVGRPVARGSDDGLTAEVLRLVTDGTRNACSILYAASARACQAMMGYEKVQTYILDSESGTSLKAAGWKFEAMTAGGDWNSSARTGRRTDQPMGPKQRWVKILTPG